MDQYQIEVTGLVQGIGFRPFVNRLANRYNLKGEIYNNLQGVIIHLSCKEENLHLFINALQKEAPVQSHITNIAYSRKQHSSKPYSSFSIIESHQEGILQTRLSPDIATCDECLGEMKNMKNRVNYPFINCTNCGPRFSIIQEMPYDRVKTTMKDFVFCSDCQREYLDVNDRRYHAQPVACEICGPQYQVYKNQAEGLKKKSFTNHEDLFKYLAKSVDSGLLVAIKGIGGYNLICSTQCEASVNELRKRKNRARKPLAVMFRDIRTAKKHLILNTQEKEWLVSWQRPIVIVNQKSGFNSNINNGLDTIGAILPYQPAHNLLFEHLITDSIIYTSANIHGHPMIMNEDEESMEELKILADVVVTHNRPIANSVDDSVIQCSAHGKMITLRRARGYTPTPLEDEMLHDNILAFGAEEQSYIALTSSKQAILSQYIGGIHSLSGMKRYETTIRNYLHLFQAKPTTAACDLHPDYSSSNCAARFAKDAQIPLKRIQHHHAHAGSCMYEHNLKGPLLAIVWDGTGWGNDKHLWGSEFFIVNEQMHFDRKDHLDYFPLLGGERAIKNPWIVAWTLMHKWGLEIPTQFQKRYQKDIPQLENLYKSKIPWTLSCGAGRYFDAMAALLEICDSNSYSGEAASLLENRANSGDSLELTIDYHRGDAMREVWKKILHLLQAGKSVINLAKAYHLALSEMIFQKAIAIIRENNLPPCVVLSGGCFQNRILLQNVINKLSRVNIAVYHPENYPSNDGGIALGQILLSKSDHSYA